MDITRICLEGFLFMTIGLLASHAEQKLRFPGNLDAGVCEAHFCS